MPKFLDDHSVIVCAGSGGVGKTTISASLGVLAAQKGRRVLVLTVDPAKRLAQALGLDDSDNVVLVPGQNYKGTLFASMLDSKKVFEEFVRTHAPDAKTAERLSNNRLFQQLSTNLSGSQEFTALERLRQAIDSGEFDLVILDTPPSQHAIHLLQAPQKIFALFQKSITRWFVQSGPTNAFQRILQGGTRQVLNVLEKLTGSQFISELSDFFESVQSLQDKVGQGSIDIHKILTGSSTGFVLVTAFDELKLKEADEFFSELRRGGYNLVSIILNRSFPEWMPQEISKSDSNFSENEKKLMDYYKQMHKFYSNQREVYSEFAKKWQDHHVNLARLPEVKDPIAGLEGIEKLAQKLNLKLGGID